MNKERFYYNRLTIIDNLKSIEPTTKYLTEDEHVNSTFQKAVKDAIEQSKSKEIFKNKKRNKDNRNDIEVS